MHQATVYSGLQIRTASEVTFKKIQPGPTHYSVVSSFGLKCCQTLIQILTLRKENIHIVHSNIDTGRDCYVQLKETLPNVLI